MDSKTILICDDDPTVRSSLSLVLKRAGYGIATAETPEQAVAQIRTTIPGLILMDMNYTRSTTGEEGLELLAKVKVLAPEVPVILITAWGSIHLAVQGIRAGAFDFITKPWNNLALLESIRTAIQVQESSTAADAAPKSPFRRDKIIGKSPLLERVLQTVSRIASTHAPVLITGESGTGKELIAEAIHENSERKDRPFIKVNLGGISLSLFESEMFGHKKGAFTDAHYDRKGRFELADGGSIFLDEIGDLDMVSQVKLLRVLQDHTFESLGDSRPKQVDTRIICATNRNLPQMVQQGEFREDLFYRINLITVQMPALRERREDIPLLVEYFARQQARQNGLEPVEISAEAMEYLSRLPYPGNVRELKNFVERTILVSQQPHLTEVDFKNQYVEIAVKTGGHDTSVHSLEEIEKQMILRALELYGGNLSKVATALGLSRQAVYRRLEKYAIRPPE
ncbi:sigma-54-dependent transcriptional regulator [Alistipes indistinctus]|jgi:two-component system NtrC family response regulator|uniref:sigma-54-dependent transcriptional regulator n=1 Tax=Alistipes indistinctus TaxID=626932 RepID=UPI000E4BC4BD|nr:sigma-54 dependent transcriptional regulator [Alistipes indistinctus]MBS1439307.1 sigma-54-dependent Fis family transcriptional regulator [Alistipes sp.]RGU36625.1 sigma-54-dependent Fis family transcriptional regulator [Alistipes indistinctus]BCG53826.1 sigma-54-dependent Fis family transcriptional regulator [Alistipes indistinctus]